MLFDDQIFEAKTEAHYAAFASLVTEYVEWCRKRYEGHAWFVERVFGYQSLESELLTLRETYGPPHGKTFLAADGPHIHGAGAYRRLPDGSCEMKRLFVDKRIVHRRGTGRKLCETLMRSAAEEGYKIMRLDTGNLMTEAIAMYKSLGFRECAPYRHYPDELMPYLVFMEIALKA